MSKALAALFDLTKATAPLHTFPEGHPEKRPYDTYASRGSSVYRKAFECLLENGLAHEEPLADTGVTIIRMDEGARTALVE